MAMGYFSPIGSELGPCEDRCSHTDCDLTRQQMESECRYCEEPIGTRGFYRDPEWDRDDVPVAVQWAHLVHGVCHLEAIGS